MIRETLKHIIRIWPGMIKFGWAVPEDLSFFEINIRQFCPTSFMIYSALIWIYRIFKHDQYICISLISKTST